MKKTNLLPIGLILVGLLLGQTAHAFTFIQAATSTDNSSGGAGHNMCSVVFPASTTVGDMIVIQASAKLATTTALSVSDDKGDSFIKASEVTSTAGALESSLWYALNIAAGTVTVSTTFTAQPVNEGFNCVAAEFSDVNNFDVTNATSGSSANYISGTSTTNFADELLIGGMGTPAQNKGINAGTNFIKVSSSSGSRSMLEYQIITIAAPWSATGNASTSEEYGMEMATFYLANNGSGEGSALSTIYGATMSGATIL